LHPLLHPIETLRGLNKSATGSSDEILSRRVGLSYLKEGLKDIYGGELVIVGRADIRPHDLVYLADTYERMYGIFEVEAVTHHLTSDTGFVTSITPNAVVTINDPARWTFQSWVWGMFGVQDTRNHVRHLMSVTADKSARAYNTVLGFVQENGEVDMSALAESIQDSIRGSVQFTGGNSALMKDIATHAATGYLKPADSKFGPTLSASEQAMQTAESIFNNPLTSAISMIPIVGSGLVDIAWSGWEWVRDNLLDQHGCYIQYLTKSGQPMDAGLSFNQGVAVGHHHTVNLLPGILNLDVKTTQNGHRRITANDLMSQLGWKEIEIASVQRQVSWWNNYWNAKVLELAGRGPDPVAIAPPNAYLAEIVPTVDGYGKYENIVDGDTIYVKKLDASGNVTGETVQIRLAGINTPELPQKEDVMANDPYDKGFLARQYIENRLVIEQLQKGFRPIVAIRESVGSGSTMGSSQDSYGRTLAVVFHNVSGEVATSEERSKKLLENATAWPLISWDAFTPEGLPYTMNWEMVTTGFAYTDMGGVSKNDPDRGYASGEYARGN
jgi:endonuclease YncB( thermonuclease family)